MLPLSTLEKTYTSILYEIPPGKPNPHQTCTLGEDTRKRVLQSSQKGTACWYYTFNFLRPRIGKMCPLELLQQRKIEMSLSQRRKVITAYEKTFPIDIFSWEARSKLQEFNKDTTALFLQSAYSNQCQSLNDLERSMIPYMEKFLKTEYKDLLDFLLTTWASRLLSANMEFLSEFPNDIEKMTNHPQWHQYNILEKLKFIDTYIRDLSADYYQLKRSSWKPSENVRDLINELKENGPLMIFGFFGSSCYLEQPFKTSETISGRAIYAWEPDVKPVEVNLHSVLVVGAEQIRGKIRGKTFVYFIDANDASDPIDRECQKIYRITFNNLTSNIFSLLGTKEDRGYGYAYYGNFNIEQHSYVLSRSAVRS